MNILVFGKFLTAIGTGLILLSIISVIVTIKSLEASTPIDSSLLWSNILPCIYSRIGETRMFLGGGGCPVSGYSALVTYAGVFLAMIGGGLMLSVQNEGTAK